MIRIISETILSFAGTNIDDLFLNALFFAQADSRSKVRAVVLGKYLGIGCLLAVSCLAASVFAAIPEKYISLLGLVPVVLGIREWLRSASAAEQEQAFQTENSSLMMTTMLVTIANGGDNIGVYVPLLAGFDFGQMVVVWMLFGVMIALWCFLSKKLTDLPGVKAFLQRNRSRIVPVVLVALGVLILIG